MKAKKYLGAVASLALAGTLSAQALVFSFDSGTDGWSATTWNGDVQSIAWDASRQALAASITEGGWHYLTNIWTNPSTNVAAYDAFNTGFANPTLSTIGFDVTVAPGTGGTYLNVIGVLQGGTTGGWDQLQMTGFNQAELGAGATKTFFTDFTLETGTALAGTGEANYQFVVGVNSDWTGGTVFVDNVRITPAAIPEPSTIGAILGAGVLGFAVYRRRKARA
jgi:hypothetical protein